MMKPLKNDDALSEVIGFVLILGVIALALSLFTVYVVPQNGREQEITHMDDVFERFVDYKLALDSLWINNQTGVTDSISFTLGSQGGNIEASGFFLPMLSPIGSSASLSVNNNTDSITITSSKTQAYQNVTSEFPVYLGELSYQSNNYYWIPQEYYYQMGGVFLSQQDGVTNRVSPFISFYKINSNAVGVNIVPLRLYGVGTFAGAGNSRVDSRLMRLSDKPDYNISKEEFNPNDWIRISVNVKDRKTAQMWQNLFDGAARSQGIDQSWYATGSGFNTTLNKGEAFIYITGHPATNNDVYLTVKRADFYVTLNNIGTAGIS